MSERERASDASAGSGRRSLGLEELLPRLRCPRSGEDLIRVGAALRSAGSGFEYPLVDGVPDLRRSPERLRIDLPWIEVWDELDRIRVDPPQPIDATDLPHHLDRYLASFAGDEGRGRWILEVGCGERLCEPYFAARDFRYVGVDADHRGGGPHARVDAHNLPIHDASFDLYLSLAVYEHLASPLLAAQEALRVLRPGGLFLGTAAFVYGFHDRASFHHMTHAAILLILRSVGFEQVRIWPDWKWTQSVPRMAFGGDLQGMPWRVASEGFLRTMEWSYTRSSNLARRLAGKRRLDLPARAVETAGSLSFAARRPAQAP